MYTHDCIANAKRDGQETAAPVTCHLSLVSAQLLEQHDCSIDSPFHELYRVSYFSCAVTELTGCQYATHTLFPAKPSIRGATERTLRGSAQTRKQHEHGITPTSPSLETRMVERRNKADYPSHPGSAAISSRESLPIPAPPLASMLHPTLNTPTPHHDPIHTHQTFSTYPPPTTTPSPHPHSTPTQAQTPPRAASTAAKNSQPCPKRYPARARARAS
jgi:hypothetical protein